MLRESSVMKRWKRNFFVFYADGNLAYFEDVSLQNRIGNFNMVTNCQSIKTALECRKEPPEGKKHGCLMTIIAKNGDDMLVCAESVDDAIAWKMTIEQPLFIAQQRHQRNQHYPVQPGQPMYPQQQTPGPTYYYPNYGVLQVMYTADGRPFRTMYIHRRRL